MVLTTNGKKILLPIKIANSTCQQARGLMFTRKKDFNFCLVFPLYHTNRFLNSVHMFFVFYKILAVFLNDKKEVVDYAVLKPFTFYIPKKDCAYLLEMPVEFEEKINVEDKVNW